MDRLDAFVALLRAEAGRQNLVSASTLGEGLWVRHIADSAQLLPLVHDGAADDATLAAGGNWADLGSGPGLPGLVIALLAPQWTVHLVESRKLRCTFLRDAISALAIPNAVVHEKRVEALATAVPFDVISARAFAPLEKLLSISSHLASESTIWLLPKGQNAVNELSTLPAAWQSLFHVEPSRTDGDARILICQALRPSVSGQ
ncbi:MAG: 16S rRNA (guanine(527)-N(7))-methyltransferase RsmG [Sphingopyxis sp.]